ncbi:MAG: DUF302 domain-containing protein [Rhodospirillaceae bacterium]|jgi:uncharacterized protein (DUF302 family)|nr:DUF302 domain-containing protein [Rhodospirillaceae bacterium]
MRKFIFIALMSALVVLGGTPDVSARSEGIVAKPSAFSVKETMDRLVAVFKSKGFRIFARVNHTAAAESIGKEIAEAELLVYGTPKISTPLLQENILSGLDLPLKTLVYEDEKGQVFLAYNHPGYIARRHEILGRDKLIGAISRILTNLTDQAVKEKL